MRVALVYDRLNKIGGAEVVLKAFHTLFPQAEWYTGVYDPGSVPFAAGWAVHSSFLSRIPWARTHHEYFPWMMPFIFESFDFSQYDLVISIGSAECKGIITGPSTLHVHYCLTPTRYLYSHHFEYLTNPAYRFIANYLRKWDLIASTRPDYMISISEHVKNRIKKYYNRESVVIYPPVNPHKFSYHATNYQLPTTNYYLTVSRLVPYKKLDLLVKAFNKNGKPLVIVGTGSEKHRLQKLAEANITLTGFVDDSKLKTYYQNAKAFIQVNEEDFGLAMVEAQSAGKPVIAYSLGGASEIVKDGKTGILFSSQTIAGICQAVDRFETINVSASVCRDNASRFDLIKWQKDIKEHIGELWIKQQKN